MKVVWFAGKRFRVYPEVYEPAEDTFMLAESLDARLGERALELGTGCGLLAVLMALAGAQVVATDVNPRALACARVNARAHGVEQSVDLRLGDLFEPVRGERFDLVVFNPPYLPVREPRGGELERAWEGGPDGRKVIDRFLDGLPQHLSSRGRAMFVHSSLAKPELTARGLELKGLRFKVSKRRLWFEELWLFQCWR